jgi:hypothetical protein
LLQLPYERVFQFRLGVFVLQSEKFKNKWIFDVRVRRILCGAAFEVTGTRSLKGER